MEEPDITVKVRDVFGIDSDWEVPAFSVGGDMVPDLDPNYYFNKEVTLAILAGFAGNQRVMVQGYHGTGKSSHIEQIAARLKWDTLRVNLDGHISRLDLIGKDAITLNNGRQITEFKEGILPWALQRPVALVFDEYDAGRPDVMFVVQRILEKNGKLILMDQNRIIDPHPYFRLFATANTVGLGDSTGMYQGTHQLSQAQMDRWNIVVALNYLPAAEEFKILRGKVPDNITDAALNKVLLCANALRDKFIRGEISTVPSARTLIAWAENAETFRDFGLAFHFSFLNRCDPAERPQIVEAYRKATGWDLKPLSEAAVATAASAAPAADGAPSHA